MKPIVIRSTSRDHGVARRQFGGRCGSLLTLRLGGKAERCRFIDTVKENI